MSNKVKNLVILGSTGSIGRQTLDIVRAMPDRFKVLGLGAGMNLALLEDQVREFSPAFISYAVPGGSTRWKLFPGCPLVTEEEMACLPDADIVVVAISGTAGLAPTLSAARAGKSIAMANKESIVAAGGLVTAAVKKSRAHLFPIDSEHSAIWQCLNGETTPPRRIILTASGGPFRTCTIAQMAGITVEQALAHPSWKMGRKVTVDSATLMNKGLEIIEAHWLFSVPIGNISVLVHPQSLIHSMVEFADGTVKAQLSKPDMRFPIQYALTYPERLDNASLPRLDWAAFPDLRFEPPDPARFPCLDLAVAAGKQGGTWPAVLCAADEVAVGLFLAGEIKFTDIARVVAGALDTHKGAAEPDLETVMAADAWARRMADDLARRLD